MPTQIIPGTGTEPDRTPFSTTRPLLENVRERREEKSILRDTLNTIISEHSLISPISRVKHCQTHALVHSGHPASLEQRAVVGLEACLTECRDSIVHSSVCRHMLNSAKQNHVPSTFVLPVLLFFSGVH